MSLPRSAFLGLAAVFVAVNGVRAAEGPRPPPPWEVYFGANAGYAYGVWQAGSNDPIFESESMSASPRLNGPLGGLQVGLNWQPIRTWVWGVEADIQLADERGFGNWTDPNYQPRMGGFASLSNEWDLTWFGTTRLRVGYAPTSRLLIFATGGVAVGQLKYRFDFSQPGAAANLPPTSTATSYSLASDNGPRVGFAAGLGVEIKLDRNWSARAESLYVDLGSTSINTFNIDGALFHVSYRAQEIMTRLGVNYALW